MMQPHSEIESTRSAALALGERFWGWEIPVYLFLGGLVAGLMIAVSTVVLLRGAGKVTPAMKTGLLLAPVLLSAGMLALFIDLTLKLNVFRFYTTLRPSAPMSLGSWVLVLVYPVQGLLILALPSSWVARLLPRGPRVQRLRAFAEGNLKALSWAGLAGGVALGVYTGILLSATVARPLWSSSALGLLFLVSGTSTGVAALMLAEREHETRSLLARADIGLIALELLTLALWMIGLLTQGPLYREAAGQMLWGPYAPVFLGVVAFGGLLLPAALELLAMRGKAMHSRLVPLLVLGGGLVLRFVVVYAGQSVGFVRA
jgi:formate-dependent nitrite reductase membrane component NrfD